MKTYKYNTETWYCDIQPLFKRLRRWFVSFGGWEMPHHTRGGYSYRWRVRHAVRLSLGARGHRSRVFALYMSMCPLSLLGGRTTFYNFGVDWYSRRRRAWYCLHYDFAGENKRMRWYAYRSANATPSGADTWYFGAPRDVIRAAQDHHDIKTLEREIREAQQHATE